MILKWGRCPVDCGDMLETTWLDGRTARWLIAADAGGDITGIHACDVTDRRRKLLLRYALEQLQATEATFRQYVEGLQQFGTTADGDELFCATEEAVALEVLANEVGRLVDDALRRERRWSESS